jgi:low affinity Fe/Cu permease
MAFAIAAAVVVVWAAVGPFFHYSDTWQLTINTGTTIVTFLMVFLIQNTQNHHSDAVQIKLDELIRAVQGAHNMMVDLENLSEEDLAEIKAKYRELGERVRRRAQRGEADTGTPRVDCQVPSAAGDAQRPVARNGAR